MKHISKEQKLLEYLRNCNFISSDEDIAHYFRADKQDIQTKIHHINFNKKKYGEFVIIRSGKKGNYVRELVTRGSDENDILDGGRKRGEKGVKQFDGRRKLLAIGLNTRQGQMNRLAFMQNVMKQNLDLSVEAQKLLQ